MAVLGKCAECSLRMEESKIRLPNIQISATMAVEKKLEEQLAREMEKPWKDREFLFYRSEQLDKSAILLVLIFLLLPLII